MYTSSVRQALSRFTLLKKRKKFTDHERENLVFDRIMDRKSISADVSYQGRITVYIVN